MSSPSSSPTSVSNPLSGYAEISKTCSRVIATLFPPMAPPPGLEIPRAPIEFEDYVAHILFRTLAPKNVVYAAMVLLVRLKKACPHLKGCPATPYRLFISSLILSSKMMMDNNCSNRSWTIVTQNLFDFEDVCRSEEELFTVLGRQAHVGLKELEEWCQEWGVTMSTVIEPIEELEKEEWQTESSDSPEVTSSEYSPSTPVVRIPESPPAWSPPAAH